MAFYPLNDLVGYLPMNETGFARLDVTGNGNNYVAPTNTNLSYGTGKLSNALKFNAGGLLVSENQTANNTLTFNTLAFWIYPTGNCNCIFGSVSYNSRISISGTTLNCTVSFEGDDYTFAIGTVNLNAWNFIVCSFGADLNLDGDDIGVVGVRTSNNNLAYYSYDIDFGISFTKIGDCAANTLLDEVAFYNLSGLVTSRDINAMFVGLYNTGNAKTYPFVNRWFYSASSENIALASNWWSDSSHTVAAGAVPTLNAGSAVQIDSTVSSGSFSTAANIIIASEIKSGASITTTGRTVLLKNANAKISGGSITCGKAEIIYPTVQANVDVSYITSSNGFMYINYTPDSNNRYYWQIGTFNLTEGGWTSDPNGTIATTVPSSTNNIYINGYFTGTLANNYPIVNVYNVNSWGQAYTGVINFYNRVGLYSEVTGTVNFYDNSHLEVTVNGTANFYSGATQAGTINGNANYYNSADPAIESTVNGTSSFYNSFNFLANGNTGIAFFDGDLFFYQNSSFNEAYNSSAISSTANFFFGGNSIVGSYIPSNRLFYISSQAYYRNNSTYNGTPLFTAKKAISLSQLLHLPFPINI